VRRRRGCVDLVCCLLNFIVLGCVTVGGAHTSSSSAVSLKVTMASTLCTLVVKDRKRTSALFWMYWGSLSSHALGTAACLSVYTRRSKAHASSSSGRKVTVAVIWRMTAWISF